MASTTRYEKVGSDTDDAASTESLLPDEGHYIPQRRQTKLWTILNGLLFFSSLVFFGFGYIQRHPSELEMMRRTSFFCKSATFLSCFTN